MSEKTNFFEKFSVNCDFIDFSISILEEYKILESKLEERNNKFDLFLEERKKSRNEEDGR